MKKTIKYKGNMDKNFDRKRLLDGLNKAEGLLRWWQENEGPSLFKRLKRILKFNFRYLFFLLAKKSPKVFRGKTFWGSGIWGTMPEYFYYSFFGIPPNDSEINLARLLIKSLKDDDVFVDAGANLGFFTLLTKAVCPRACVHAFEPTSTTFGLLEKSTKILDGVSLNQNALTNTVGKIGFFIDPNNSPGNSILRPAEDDFNEIVVDGITLDDYCLRNNIRPSVVKLDVEGVEGEVIRGGLGVIQSSRPTIVMEFMRERNESHVDAVNLLIKMGYRVFSIDKGGDLRTLSIEEGFDLVNFVPEGKLYDNFVFKAG